MNKNKTMDSINTQRVEKLPKKTEGRRISVVPANAPDGAEHAPTPEDIKNVKQLQHWAVNKPEQYLEWLNEFWYERDKAFKGLQDWYRLAEIIKDTLHEADLAQIRLQEAKKENTRLKAELIPLRGELEAKDERIAQLDELLMLAE